MADEITASDQIDEITDQQFLRAVTSFEAIIVSQIQVKNKLGDRLNNAIRAGIIILGIIAVSLLILLLTLSSQIGRISNVVGAMNQDFSTVSVQMSEIDTAMISMELRMKLLEGIAGQTQVMDQEVVAITADLETMRGTMAGIKSSVKGVRGNISNIAVSIDHMNVNVQQMGYDMQRMGRSARSLNKIFPFPLEY
ncbi:translation initiation factor 2 [Candidatus Vondammii sp. HM_W22]|uniref:translation initiation factor 2 n=1 Tax=Candidatus Vondammii sp. HM_W22 TaxID=2687299 RepID=UPI001F14017C|nr:translation initiation factor 2 [Candidatus Vondammii sp. HM_W22]